MSTEKKKFKGSLLTLVNLIGSFTTAQSPGEQQPPQSSTQYAQTASLPKLQSTQILKATATVFWSPLNHSMS